MFHTKTTDIDRPQLILIPDNLVEQPPRVLNEKCKLVVPNITTQSTLIAKKDSL